MSLVMKASIILYNMIIQDECEVPKLNIDYLFEDANQFKVDCLIHDDGSHLLGSFDILCIHQQYMGNHMHFQLKNDLVEELWQFHRKYNEK
jgi:hypothetical protein